MLRSMFSAISGLRAHQTMMDVVGNNIANVNTSGFKASRATFEETLTQVQRGATPATAASGGTDPLAIGLGVRVSSTDSDFGQGSSQVTGRRTDVAIQGDGFFVIERNGQVLYERAGAFNIDADGNLVGRNGEWVLGGVAATPALNATVPPPDISNGDPSAWEPGDFQRVSIDLTQYEDVQIGSNGTVTAREISSGEMHTVAQIAMARFANNEGLTRNGDGEFLATPASGQADIGWPNEGGRGFLQAGTLEMSNVDLAAEFTNMIIAQRGFQANSRTITTSDEVLGELVNLKR